MSQILHTTNATFENDVLKNDKLTFVDFFADWCGPCKMLAPIIEELSTEMDDVTFVKINVDENQELAIKYNVRSIPTLLLFKNGEVVDTIIGILPKPKLIEKLNKLK